MRRTYLDEFRGTNSDKITAGGGKKMGEKAVKVYIMEYYNESKGSDKANGKGWRVLGENQR